MKKIIAIILTCALLLCLCACNPGPTESTDSVENSLETTTATTTSGESKDNITQNEPFTTLATTATTPTKATTTAKVTTKKATNATKATTKKVTTTAKETTAKAPTTKPTISKEEYAKRIEFRFIGSHSEYNDDFKEGASFEEKHKFSRLTYFLLENINPAYKIKSVTIDSVIYKGIKCKIYQSEKEDLLMSTLSTLCGWMMPYLEPEDALKVYNPLKVAVFEIKPALRGEALDEIKEEDRVFTVEYTITFEGGDTVTLSQNFDDLCVGGGGMPLSPEELQ